MADEAKTAEMQTKTTIADETTGTFYMLPGDCNRYTREQLLSMMMPCKEGLTSRFVENLKSAEIRDRSSGRVILAKNENSQLPEQSVKKKPVFFSRSGGLFSRVFDQRDKVQVVHSKPGNEF